MPIYCHRDDTLSMLVGNELVSRGVKVEIVKTLPPSGEGIAIYSEFSKEAWTEKVQTSIYVSSEEDIPRVVQDVLRKLWHEMSLPERAIERKQRRTEEKRRRKRLSQAMGVSS